MFFLWGSKAHVNNVCYGVNCTLFYSFLRNLEIIT